MYPLTIVQSESTAKLAVQKLQRDLGVRWEHPFQPLGQQLYYLNPQAGYLDVSQLAVEDRNNLAYEIEELWAHRVHPGEVHGTKIVLGVVKSTLDAILKMQQVPSTKPVSESLSASKSSPSAKKRRGKRGGQAQYDAKTDDRIVQDWNTAHNQGMTKQEFVRERELYRRRLDKTVERVETVRQLNTILGGSRYRKRLKSDESRGN